jgi:hypothetical protein
MTIQSWGYAGTIAPGTVWAQMQWGLGRRYWVRDFASVRATVVASGTRQISLSAGYFGGYGILDFNDTSAVVTLPAVATGTRYFMVVGRRTWGTTRATTFEVIDVGTAPAVTGRNVDPGAVDDQPLWLVPVTAGQAIPGTPIDLRVIGTEGGTYRANSDLVRQYLTFEGARLEIGGTEWKFEAGSSGTAAWVADPGVGGRVNLPVATQGAVITATAGWTFSINTTAAQNRATRQGNVVHLHFEMRRITNGRIVSDANGNFPDTEIGIVAAAFRPLRRTPILGFARAATAASTTNNITCACMLYLDPNGRLVLASGLAGLSIAVDLGDTVTLWADHTFIQETA